jgi:hypothetical protein
MTSAYLVIPKSANGEAPHLEMLSVNGRDEKLRFWCAADEGHANLDMKCIESAAAFRIYGMHAHIVLMVIVHGRTPHRTTNRS